MKLRNILFTGLSLTLLIFSCNDDDDSSAFLPERDRAEVYAEDLLEIETFLSTHYYNYEEFNNNAAYSDTSTNPVSNTQNDSFEIKYFEITNSTPSSTLSIMDMLNNEAPESATNVLRYKMVTDNSGLEYKLYYLVVRKGLGSSIHSLDRGVFRYKGILSDQEEFDSAVTPISLNLSSLGNNISGVVNGLRQTLIEFKTLETYTEDDNANITYHNHGIGAAFVPSGLGYFSLPISDIPAYTPIFFNFDLIDKVEQDFDFDNVPSSVEDLDNDQDGFNDDTDGDGTPNFLDTDDDNDGVLTRDEDLEDTDLNFDSDGDGDPTNDKNGDGNPLNDDTDGDGIPNYLDADTTLSRD